MRSKEREEAIEILAMDPKVYGKLLTTHGEGDDDDEEGLCDGSPSARAPEQAPRWDLADTEGYGGGNCVSSASWMFSGYIGIYI